MRWITLSCLFFLGAVNAAAAPENPPEATVIILRDGEFAERMTQLFQSESSMTAAEAAPPDEPGEIALAEEFEKIFHAAGEWFYLQRSNLLTLFTGLAVTVLAAWLVNRLFWGLVTRIARRFSRRKGDDSVGMRLRAPSLLLLISFGAYLSGFPLMQSVGMLSGWMQCFYIMLTICVVWALFRLIDLVGGIAGRNPERDRTHGLLSSLMRKAFKCFLAVMACFFVGQSILGINLTALLAGAGVAGVAVAFAAQDSLANIFGSIAIILDRSFSAGDRVRIGEVDGIIEETGFRTTRIRSLDGNLFTVPNRHFADSMIENVSQRPYIKEVFVIRLPYEATPGEMRRAKEIFDETYRRPDFFDMEKLPPRIVFSGFGGYGLEFTFYCWFNTRDFFQAQAWRTELNFSVARAFEQAGLSFGYLRNGAFNDNNQPGGK